MSIIFMSLHSGKLKIPTLLPVTSKRNNPPSPLASIVAIITYNSDWSLLLNAQFGQYSLGSIALKKGFGFFAVPPYEVVRKFALASVSTIELWIKGSSGLCLSG